MKFILISVLLLVVQSIYAQNVGIGLNNPSEKLQVAGSVKADAFKYSNPKIGVISIPAASFSKQFETGSLEKYPSSVFFNAPTNSSMLAPVSLPHNAIITAFTVYFNDQSVTEDMVVHLHFFNYLGFYSPIASVISSGSGGFINVTDNTILPGFTRVNNLLGSYSIEAYSSTGTWSGSDMQIMGVVITYTVAETN